MSYMWRISLLLACLLLSGCVVTQQDLQMQRDLLETKRRLDEAERGLRELQADMAGGVRAHVETLARNQADFQAGLDGVRVDVQSVQGRVGEQARVNDELRQELGLLRDELSLQVADHEQRLALLESRATEGLPANASASVSTLPPAASAAASTAASASSAAVEQPTPAGESASDLYARALRRIRNDQSLADGRSLMQLFLKRYPEDPLAVNAAYWVGETYYAEKAYDMAILQFEDVIQKYGEHPKVASAMLKQAFAFEALGDKGNSRLLLQRVIDRFPLSEEAARAKEKLSLR